MEHSVTNAAAANTARQQRWRRPRALYAVLRRRIIPSRSRRVYAALVLLWVLNIFDLVVTLLRVQAGGFEEANPVARMLLSSPAGLAAWKLVLLTAATVIFDADPRSISGFTSLDAAAKYLRRLYGPEE